jgi:3-methylcrotonyl-CoA carboxylase beta subunit
VSHRESDIQAAVCAEAYARGCMTVLTTRVDRTSEAFAARRVHMEGLLAELRERTALVGAGGGVQATERHRSRGKLTARERIDLLVDPGTAFLELNALAGWEMYDGQAPAAGVVTGIGVIEGRCCVVPSPWRRLRRRRHG